MTTLQSSQNYSSQLKVLPKSSAQPYNSGVTSQYEYESLVQSQLSPQLTQGIRTDHDQGKLNLQDLYLKDFQVNRRKRLELDNKNAQSMLKEMILTRSQSQQTLFRKHQGVYDRKIPGLKQFIAKEYSSQSKAKPSTLDDYGLNGSSLGMFNSASTSKLDTQHQTNHKPKIKKQPKQLETVYDEWNMRCKLIQKLSDIQQQQKYFYGKLEDHYEAEEELKTKKYFNHKVRDKLEGQYNDLPVSLVALQYNRQFIMDQMINRKGYFSSNPKEKILADKPSRLLLDPKFMSQRIKDKDGQQLNQQDMDKEQIATQKERNFLRILRRESVNKFKNEFLEGELKQIKTKQAKRMQSRSQFDNAASLYRFLPKDKRKKVKSHIKIVIDPKERKKEMEQCLEQCINGTEESEAQEDIIDRIMNNNQYSNFVTNQTSKMAATSAQNSSNKKKL
ncbi:UNKNOWN [Stylonychia lemnae]|uniref:Uncharacterized protein n=1 Tax=Stylonychia lemnae TaxID=5949 RepID=A0A078ACM3_STYLE|nr:UNKNOWN [Stylonychia lemnae]|eukprot:CDW79611.1 UNKNOWN [Stylonychia lemnae]